MDIGDMINPKLFLLASVIVLVFGYSLGVPFVVNFLINISNFAVWYILYPFVLKQISRTKDE